MTSVSKNVYIDKLDDLVKKYNNTFHSTTKMTPAEDPKIEYQNKKKHFWERLDSKYSDY